MDFFEAVEYVASLEKRGWRLGLDRMQEFLHRVGLQDAIGSGKESPKFIHVGGTNGKGSVSAYVQWITADHGLKSGGYFSPYVYEIRERIQIDCTPISEREFAQCAIALRPSADDMVSSDFGGPTEFEFKTAMGFLAWQRAGCDLVALEVGLGGRLDATNVVHPASTVIVSIGHDHMEILGNSLASVATEKAGIVKEGIPLIVGHIDNDGANRAILDQARNVGAPVWQFGKEIAVEMEGNGWTVRTPIASFPGLQPKMKSSIQPHNVALAIAALLSAGVTLDPERVRDAVSTTTLPGRFEQIKFEGRTLLLDGAHNLEAAQVLRTTLLDSGLATTVHPAVLVTGMLAGHESHGFYEQLNDLVQSVHVAPIDFHRSRKAAELALEISPLFRRVHEHDSASEALDFALQDSQPGQTVLVTGSFYLVGEIGRLIRTRKH